jgi:hypothetical protein
MLGREELIPHRPCLRELPDAVEHVLPRAVEGGTTWLHPGMIGRQFGLSALQPSNWTATESSPSFLAVRVVECVPTVPTG